MTKPIDWGVFMPVGEGGWIRSTTAPPVPATWEYNRRVAVLAEETGLNFLFAMAKWRGFGGETGHWDKTIESITMIAALAEATKRPMLIPTVHTLAWNVGLVAKMIVTLDQISNGRAGLNIVSGWFTDELGQFGLWPENITHDERYEVAREWVQACKRLWTEDRVNFDGKYITLSDAYSDPKPVQKPHPPIICAGTSDTGLQFTVEEANACFLSGPTHEDVAAISRRAKQIAKDLGKRTLTYQMAMVIPGETVEEGFDRHLLYTEGTDMVAKKAGLNGALKEIEYAKANGIAVSDKLLRRVERSQTKDPYIPGFPYYGTPESIADQFEEMINDGDLDGFVLTFPDFIGDLEYFGRRVMPVLAERGLARPFAIDPVGLSRAPAEALR